MTQKITLKDLARISGLAPSTISRALKDHPDISKSTKETVRKLAEQLKYTPDAIALSLRNRKSHQIAVIIPEITNYFYTEVLDGIMESARQHGYNILLFDSKESQEQEILICRSIIKSGVEGVLVSTTKNTRNSEHFNELKESGMPIVFFDRICGDVDSDKVVADNFCGAYDAVTQMLAAGCRRIAHFSAEQHLQTAQKRQMGYIQALIENRFVVDRNLIIPCDNPKDAAHLTKTLMKKYNVDGIFAIDDRVAIEIMAELKVLGYKIPEEVAVCGFGNGQISAVTTPALTTVEQEGKQMGKIAIGLLLKRITATSPFDTATQILKTRPIIRASTLR